MSHTCHWPDCDQRVPPQMWGCSKHWFMLPKDLRDRIWRAYRPGQEITKTPSRAYIEAAQAAQEWIRERQPAKEQRVAITPAELQGAIEGCLEQRGDGYYATQAGCLRLQEWLAYRGMNASVTISPKERFKITVQLGREFPRRPGAGEKP